LTLGAQSRGKGERTPSVEGRARRWPWERATQGGAHTVCKKKSSEGKPCGGDRVEKEEIEIN